MSTIDIRTAVPAEITEVRFAEPSRFDYIADTVRKNNSSESGIRIDDSNEGSRYLVIRDKEHANNLRKALDKAEQMGWLK